jgi:hypothetical protein
MGILDLVMNQQDGAAVDELASAVGLQGADARRALEQLVPALAGGMKRNAASADGLDALLGALSRGNHQRYVERPASLGESATVDDGNRILGHIFGSKEVSREVAGRAAASTGIDAATLRRMLPLVAALVMGSLSRQSAGQGAGGLGSLGSLLDSDGDGSIADDLFDIARKFF